MTIITRLGRIQNVPYARLVHFLKDAGLLEETAFLSMNYDVLLDRVIHSSVSHISRTMASTVSMIRVQRQVLTKRNTLLS